MLNINEIKFQSFGSSPQPFHATGSSHGNLFLFQITKPSPSLSAAKPATTSLSMLLLIPSEGSTTLARIVQNHSVDDHQPFKSVFQPNVAV